MEVYTKAAKKEGVSVEEYLRLLVKSKRKKINIKNIGDLGKQTNKITLELVDELGNSIGELTRSVDKKRRLIYRFNQGNELKDFSCESYLLHHGMAKEFRVPVLQGENIIYADFYVPSSLTEKYSGFLKVMMDDSLKFLKNNKKLPEVDGNFGVWIKSELIYEDFGGQSVNLTKFWEARKKGKTIKDAAFETPTGIWAKQNGFNNVWWKNDDDISFNKVILKFLK